MSRPCAVTVISFQSPGLKQPLTRAASGWTTQARPPVSYSPPDGPLAAPISAWEAVQRHRRIDAFGAKVQSAVALEGFEFQPQHEIAILLVGEQHPRAGARSAGWYRRSHRPSLPSSRRARSASRPAIFRRTAARTRRPQRCPRLPHTSNTTTNPMTTRFSHF